MRAASGQRAGTGIGSTEQPSFVLFHSESPAVRWRPSTSARRCHFEPARAGPKVQVSFSAGQFRIPPHCLDTVTLQDSASVAQ